MARLALKPDSSFFRKIAVGAVGTRSVCLDLDGRGHQIAELERGSLDTKLWKDVKRKRVRIPDLVCQRCGLRVESRAKTKPDLSMSHSLADEARAWDFGMVDTDCVAFPVCRPTEERFWSAGKLGKESSYWHERNWVRWQLTGPITYFRVGAFRSTPHTRTRAKGVTEGSETIVSWNALFSSRTGTVEAVDGSRLTIRRTADGHLRTCTVPATLQIWVSEGQAVEAGQVLASSVRPPSATELSCPARLPEDHIAHLLASRERTQRFTGIKLARLRAEEAYRDPVADLTADEEEDVYVRLEGASFLASVCGLSAMQLFRPYLTSPDAQTQLEAVIALGETANPEAIELLSGMLGDTSRPYFMRSAAAWSLSRTGARNAAERLVRAFSDVDRNIREEALEGLVSIGGEAVPLLLAGLREITEQVAAGCAEALRQQQPLPEDVVANLISELHQKEPSRWAVWLIAHLPRERVATSIAALQESSPELHYAISLLWSFVESWIARRWELSPGPAFPASEDFHVV